MLCGQSSLLDLLYHRSCKPLASRIVTRTHLKPLSEPKTREYIAHHMAVAGVTKQLFDDAALTAVYQGSAGVLRKINHLCRGALLATALDNCKKVDAEHVRRATRELM